MKKILLFAVFFLFINALQAQDLIHKKVLLGIETGLSGTYAYTKLSDTDKLKSFGWRLAPYAGVFLLKNKLAIGATGEYATYKSNFDERPEMYGWGAFIRYYHPLKIKNKKYISEHFLFHGEFSYNKVNYYKEGVTIVGFDTTQETVLRFSVGIDYRLWKQLYMAMSMRPEIYIGRPNAPVSFRLGFEYHL